MINVVRIGQLVRMCMTDISWKALPCYELIIEVFFEIPLFFFASISLSGICKQYVEFLSEKYKIIVKELFCSRN